ncbi:MAG TPA: helix-turn-helix domain-containing protein [Spirillospora sp.]|nr:helix-turn-helix domain-containing protein [Spirillospora sp.]
MGRLDDEHARARRQRELAGPDGPANPADFSEALARGLAVLSAFGAERRRLTQAELARELGISRATVRRAVLTLEHLGYLKAEGRSYELTPRVLRLAQAYLTSNVVSTVLQPICDRICRDLNASCSVAVLDGADAVMIARAVPHLFTSGLGFRVPAARSALGKVLLAHLESAADADDGTLNRVRAEGRCYVADDVEMGFHSMAVPIRQWDGRVVAALNVGAGLGQISRDDMFGQVLDVLVRSAEEAHGLLV